jgi:uncharacterized membrane protein YoaK (UPF0700 family)
MTGNTVLTGISLANSEYIQAVERASTFLTFFAGAMLGRLLLRLARSPWLPLCFEAILLMICTGIDQAHSLAISLITLAMGIQATAITRFKGKPVSTVVVTSTLARLAEAALDSLARHRIFGGMDGSGGTRLLMVTWLAYVLGAMLAVLLANYVAAPLAVSAGILFLTSWITRRHGPTMAHK